MKPLYILAVSAILMCACHEKEIIDAPCDTKDSISHCIDDYHYTQCTQEGPVTTNCCSDEAIADGSCDKICLMNASGARCETVSSKGSSKCGNTFIDSGEDCDTFVPDGMSCSDVIRGSYGNLSCNSECKIDSSECKIPVPGEHCNLIGDLNNGGCDEKGRRFYCEDGVTHVTDCSMAGGICSVFSTSAHTWRSDCINPQDTCDTLGEIKRRCYIDLFDEMGAYKTALHICAHDDISNKNYWLLADDPQIDYCAHSCDRDKGECSRLSTDEGTPCEVESFTPRCDGSIAVDCASDDVGTYTVRTQNCANTNMKCVVFDNSPKYYNIAYCANPKDKCDEKVFTDMCFSDISCKMSCTPLVGSDEMYFVCNSTTSCPNGCNPDTGKCFTHSDQEGKSCSSKYKSSCLSDDVLLYCNEDNEIASRVCVNELGQTGYCVEKDGKANCAYPCDSEGQTRSTCITGTDLDRTSYTITETCTEIDNHLVYFETSREDCYLACSADKSGCHKFLDTDGEACSDNAVNCYGNILSWCQSGKRSSFDCAYYNQICVTLDSESGSCFTSCDEIDSEITRCALNSEQTAYETVSYVCTQSDNGTKYYKPTASETCPDECNDTWTECEICNPGDTKSLCTSTSEDFVATFQMECKMGGHWDYVRRNGNYVYEVCSHGCNADNTACRQGLLNESHY